MGESGGVENRVPKCPKASKLGRKLVEDGSICRVTSGDVTDIMYAIDCGHAVWVDMDVDVLRVKAKPSELIADNIAYVVRAYQSGTSAARIAGTLSQQLGVEINRKAIQRFIGDVEREAGEKLQRFNRKRLVIKAFLRDVGVTQNMEQLGPRFTPDGNVTQTVRAPEGGVMPGAEHGVQPSITSAPEVVGISFDLGHQTKTSKPLDSTLVTSTASEIIESGLHMPHTQQHEAEVGATKASNSSPPPMDSSQPLDSQSDASQSPDTTGMDRLSDLISRYPLDSKETKDSQMPVDSSKPLDSSSSQDSPGSLDSSSNQDLSSNFDLSHHQDSKGSPDPKQETSKPDVSENGFNSSQARSQQPLRHQGQAGHQGVMAPKSKLAGLSAADIARRVELAGLGLNDRKEVK